MFKPPQKKKTWDKDSYVAQLPVPVSSITRERASVCNWKYYKGRLIDDHVIVDFTGDVEDLMTQGFFGKAVGSNIQLKMSERTKEEADSSADNIETACDRVVAVGLSVKKSVASNSQSSQNDVLRLNLEESFFLSFALGCIFIKHLDGVIDISRQWTLFCSIHPRFPLTYAAYHHFRSKGWVPRDGVRYGVDMVLYRKGPPFYHSSYIVVVRCVDAKSLQSIAFNGEKNRDFTWATLSGMLRLATTVSKEIMFCNVLVPADLSTEEKLSPKCLQRFQVQEILCTRWASTKERENELADIDCDY